MTPKMVGIDSATSSTQLFSSGSNMLHNNIIVLRRNNNVIRSIGRLSGKKKKLEC